MMNGTMTQIDKMPIGNKIYTTIKIRQYEIDIFCNFIKWYETNKDRFIEAGGKKIMDLRTTVD